MNDILELENRYNELNILVEDKKAECISIENRYNVVLEKYNSIKTELIEYDRLAQKIYKYDQLRNLLRELIL